LDNTEPICNV